MLLGVFKYNYDYLVILFHIYTCNNELPLF